MMSIWAEIALLPEGEHLHLDELLEAPPASGSLAWQPIIDDLIDFLLIRGGVWHVWLPLGSIEQLSTGELSFDDPLRGVSEMQMPTPPAVYRQYESNRHNDWEGERIEISRSLRPYVVEKLSASRSDRDARAGDPFDVAISFAVNSAHP